jgi:hypothetical protein
MMSLSLSGMLTAIGGFTVAASKCISFESSAGLPGTAAGDKLVLYEGTGGGSANTSIGFAPGGTMYFNLKNVAGVSWLFSTGGATVATIDESGHFCGANQPLRNVAPKRTANLFVTKAMTSGTTEYVLIPNSSFTAQGESVRVSCFVSSWISGGTGTDTCAIGMQIKTGSTYIVGDWSDYFTNKTTLTIGRTYNGTEPVDDIFTVTKGATYSVYLKLMYGGDDSVNIQAGRLMIYDFV